MKKYIIGLTLVVLFVSCSKDNTNTYRYEDFLGVWEGRYSSSVGGSANQQWLIHLKTDSTILVYNTYTDTANASKKGKGRFTTFDNTVVAVFDWGGERDYYISAEMTPSKDRIAGMWGIGNEDKGDTFLDKR